MPYLLLFYRLWVYQIRKKLGPISSFDDVIFLRQIVPTLKSILKIVGQMSWRDSQPLKTIPSY